MAEPPAPQVPQDGLGDGWERTSDETETLFELPAAVVRGRTVIYEDRSLERAIRNAHGVENLSRFVFATRLSFSPSLAAGAHTVIRPTVVSEARSEFEAVLENRGFLTVQRQRRQRMRTESGARATLFGYHAAFPVEDGTLPIEGWLAVWYDDGFVLAGGAYPRHFGDLDVTVDPTGFRDHLLELLRTIE